jgi:hypothetical protein
MAVEVAAGLDVAFGFEVALGFAAAVPQSIGRCCSFSQLPLGPFVRSAQVNDIAHPAPMSRSGGVSSHVASEPNAPIAWRRVLV